MTLGMGAAIGGGPVGASGTYVSRAGGAGGPKGVGGPVGGGPCHAFQGESLGIVLATAG